MRKLLLPVMIVAAVGCDSGRPTSFDVDVALLPYGDNPASAVNVMFVAPGAAGAAGDTVRFDGVALPWTYKARGLGMGQYTLQACVVGKGAVQARLDVNDGYQGFITHGFGEDYVGHCARGSFRVSDRTERPPWEQ